MTNMKLNNTIIDNLVSQAQSGSEDAKAKLYMLYIDRLEAYLEKEMSCSIEAHDLAAETLISVLGRIETLEIRKSFAGILYKEASYRMYNFYRYGDGHYTRLYREKVNSEGDEVSEADFIADQRTPETELDRNLMSGMVMDALKHLSQEKAEAVRMFLMEDMGKQEIAEALGLKLTTVVGRINMARKEMQEYLCKNYGDVLEGYVQRRTI